MQVEREYSDFLIVMPVRRPLISRRGLVAGCAAVAGAGAFRPHMAAAGGPMTIVNGINAVMGLVTNFDALSGNIWPKVQSFFGGGRSAVTNATASRVANEIGDILLKTNNIAVSITDNRTTQHQRGDTQHYFNQDFTQAFVDWCTCNAEMHLGTAAKWREIAQILEARGDYGGAQTARRKAAEDQTNSNMWLSKLQKTAFYEPVPMSLPAGKPAITALPAHPEVVQAVDKGDYFVSHAVARINKDSQVTVA